MASPYRRAFDLDPCAVEVVGTVGGTLSIWSDVVMRNEFTGVVEKDGEWSVAYCPEIPGANG